MSRRGENTDPARGCGCGVVVWYCQNLSHSLLTLQSFLWVHPLCGHRVFFQGGEINLGSGPWTRILLACSSSDVNKSKGDQSFSTLCRRKLFLTVHVARPGECECCQSLKTCGPRELGTSRAWVDLCGSCAREGRGHNEVGLTVHTVTVSAFQIANSKHPPVNALLR